MEVLEEENRSVDAGVIVEEPVAEVEEIKDENTEVKEQKPCLRTLNEMKGNQMIIDLESGSIKPRKLTGPEMLYQKFLKTQAKPKTNKDTVCMNILTVENGKLGLQKVEVKLDKEVELDHNRPGFSREKLKQNLRNQIVQKRLEIIKNKGLKSEYEPEEKEEKSSENKENRNNSDDSDDEYDPEAEAEENEDEEDEESEPETIVKKKKKATQSSAFIDSEAVDEDDEENLNDEEEEDDDDSSESSDESEEEIEQNTQKKGRILKAFVDSDDEQQPVEANENETKTLDTSNVTNTQDSNIFKESQELNTQATDFTFNEPSVSEDIIPSRLEGLFDSAPLHVDDDDLMDICSGQFFVTQPVKETEINSQDDVDSQVNESVVNEDFQLNESIINEISPDESEKIDETPETEKPEEKVEVKINARKLLESSDDEADNEFEPIPEKKRVKKKKSKQKTKKLGFSDDESDGEEGMIIQNAQQFELDSEMETCEEEEEEEQIEDEEKAEGEVLIDYDSEENEIEVKMTRKDKIKEAQKYFENEAELSESEWGSADEDEKDMDKYDIEFADEEQFDQAKLREEVGRIHARKVMDEDLKNVKKIQELLFENEENDGVGRERKFRWKNQTEGFTMEDENARDADDNPNEMDDESEAMWRKMRHERDTLINEQSQKLLESESMTGDILLLDQNSQTVTSSNTSALVKRKFQIIRTSSVTMGRDVNSEQNKKESPFLIKADQRKFSNSFLSKGDKMLARMASFMSSKGAICDDEVTIMSSNGGSSMSFAPIEKTDDSKKRKSEGNDGSAQKANCKKRKVENHRFLLDQLA